AVFINVGGAFVIVDILWSGNDVGDFSTGFHALHDVVGTGTVFWITDEVIQINTLWINSQRRVNDLVIRTENRVFNGSCFVRCQIRGGQCLNTSVCVASDRQPPAELAVFIGARGFGGIPRDSNLAVSGQVPDVCIQWATLVSLVGGQLNLGAFSGFVA